MARDWPNKAQTYVPSKGGSGGGKVARKGGGGPGNKEYGEGQAGKGGYLGGKGGAGGNVRIARDLYKGQINDNPVGRGYQGVCWSCGKVGHKKSECRNLNQQEGWWKVNEVEEELGVEEDGRI